MKSRFALILCCVSSAALARQAPAPQVPRFSTYRVELKPLILLAGAGEQVGQERLVGEGEVVMESGLAYPTIAVLGAPIDIVIAGEHIVVPAGRPAFEEDARGGALAGLRNARVFCLPPHQPNEPRNDIQFRQDFGARFPNRQAQACFVDRDRDSQLDFAFLAGTNWPEDREPVPLDHVPYNILTDQRLPNSRLRIVFVRGGLLQGMQLECQVTAFGQSLPLSEVQLMSDQGRPAWSSIQRNVGGTYPRSISFGRARIDLLSYDREARQIRARVSAQFERSEMKFRFITNVIYIAVPH